MHCNVVQRTEYEGHKLGSWLRDQRAAKKATGGHNRMSEGREAQLQALVDAGQLWCVLLENWKCLSQHMMRS